MALNAAGGEIFALPTDNAQIGVREGWLENLEPYLADQIRELDDPIALATRLCGDKTFYGSVMFERSGVDEKSRAIQLSFSSELAVERNFGNEILDHSPGAVDLSRLNGSAPLLVDHNPRDLVGVVERAEVIGRKGIANVRFSRTGRGEDVFSEVRDGIRRGVSVGYKINKMVREGDGDNPTYRATSWTPMEISLVGIPADASIGIGRNAS